MSASRIGHLCIRIAGAQITAHGIVALAIGVVPAMAAAYTIIQ